MEMKFYRCSHCGQIVAMVKNKGVPIICCGEPMKEIIAGESDGGGESPAPLGVPARMACRRRRSHVGESLQSVAHEERGGGFGERRRLQLAFASGGLIGLGAGETKFELRRRRGGAEHRRRDRSGTEKCDFERC